MLAAGVFFMCNKPFSKTHGEQKNIADYIFGVFVIFAGIYIFIAGLL